VTVFTQLTNTIVWLGGDYNLPDIDWVNLSTRGNPSYGSLNDYLLDMLNDNKWSPFLQERTLYLTFSLPTRPLSLKT